jgi:glycine cleavage system H protein
MSLIPTHLKYTKEHEWIKIENDKAIFGITHFAQEKLGDIVYLDAPKLGQKVKQMQVVCVVESVKAASDIYAPISGTISKINTDLQSSPELINQSPYDKGWIGVFENFNLKEIDTLLSAQEYEELLKQGH